MLFTLSVMLVRLLIYSHVRHVSACDFRQLEALLELEGLVQSCLMCCCVEPWSPFGIELCFVHVMSA